LQRRVDWETTLQLSLTLALANPVLWYLIDRTTSGFFLSGILALIGTGGLFLTNPALIPAPTLSFNATNPYAIGGLDKSRTGPNGAPGHDSDGISVAIWIASVLFCSCVCFGNIGRLLSSNPR